MSDNRVSVTCAKRSWLLREATAYRWLVAIQHDPDKLSGIFPGLLTIDDVDPMLAAMELFSDIELRWERTARKALERAAGMEWFRALNLSNKILEGWTIADGALLLSGCDARSMPLSSWLNAAYVHLIRGMDENDQRRFQFDLDKIPAGATPVGTSSAVRRSLAAFASD